MNNAEKEIIPVTPFETIYQKYTAMCENPLLLVPTHLKDESTTASLLGGLTNQNYLVESTKSESKYVLHVLNPGLRHFLNRPVVRPEGLPGPTTILTTESVLLEEFVPNKGPLGQLPENSFEHLAKILATIHRSTGVTVPEQKSGSEPKIQRFLQNIRAVEQDIMVRIAKLEDKSYYAEVVRELVNDSELLRKSLNQLPQDIVYCHNDFNLSNILELEAETDRQRFGGPFLLVDYEYAGWNYRCFDIANFLHESECRFYDDAPYFDLIDEFHQGNPDGGESFLKEYYRQSGIGTSYSEFAAVSRKAKIYSLYFWLLLAIHEAPGGWQGTKRYVELKLESYRRLRDAL